MGSGEGTGEGKGGCAACSEGCIKCARVTLIVFNSIFLAVGVGILGSGIWMQVDPNITSILQIAGGVDGGADIIRVVSYVLLAVGAFIIVVNIFGLAGASRWNQCLLATYISLIVILIAGEITVVALGFAGSQIIGDAFKSGMNAFMVNNYDDTDNALSNAWRQMQASRRCCGVDGYQDWQNLNTNWWQTSGSPNGWNWPRTCCELENVNDPNSNLVDEAACRAGTGSINTRGCYIETEYFLRIYAYAIGGALIGVFVLQCLVLTFASIVHRGLVVYETESNNVKPMMMT